MTVPKVAVVVLNWNGWEDTIACLESLLQSDYPRIGIIVCDNASPNDSVGRLLSWGGARVPEISGERVSVGKEPVVFHDLSTIPTAYGSELSDQSGGPGVITFIQTGANLGYAGGNNVGLRYALAEGYDFFWVLNNDTEVAVDAISRLIERMEEDTSIGLCGSTLIYYSRRDLIQNLGGGGFNRLKGRGVPLGHKQAVEISVDRAEIEAELAYISGAAAMASRNYLERVGLMQDDYFLFWEELDWSFRARDSFKLGYAPGSLVFHKVGASIGTSDFGQSSPLSDHYMVRNRIKLCFRFSPISLPFVFYEVSRDVFRWLRRGDPDRALLLARAALGRPFRQEAS